MDPEILAQIPVVERALGRPAFAVWPMVEYEADDALGAAAAIADADDRVEQVLIVTPDKDLGQCVRGNESRAVRPSQAGDHRRGRRRSRSSASAPRRSPTTSASSATPPTASRACRAGAPRAPRRARPLRPPRGHPAGGRAVGRRRPARRGEAVGDAAGRTWPRPCCSAGSPPSSTDVDVGAVDDWRWTGPTDDFAAVGRSEIGAPDARPFAARLTPP